MNDNKVLYQIKSLDILVFRKVCSIYAKNKKEKNIKATPTQMQILAYILKCGNKDIYQKDLEDVLNLRRATVSGVLQTMEKNELIKRVTDNKDTRSKKIILQKKSINIFNTYKNLITEIENKIVQNISEEEIEVFCKVINKMKENIKII